MRAQRLTTRVWAEEIRVERNGESLIVTGKNHVTCPVAGVPVEADLLAQSVPLARWPEDRRKKPPHIEFANATNDNKLIEFCKKWGPFNGSTLGRPRWAHRGWKLVVRENLPQLRADQVSFSGLARLIAELQSKEPNLDRISQYFPSGERQLFFDFALIQSPGLPLAKATFQFAQTLVCQKLEEYPPHLYPTTAGPVELPPMDPHGLGKGIKHVLYGLLRFEYLRKDRIGLGVCPHCDEVFAKERKGAVYCGKDCSTQHRSLEYYWESGRAKRQEAAGSVHRFSRRAASPKRSRI